MLQGGDQHGVLRPLFDVGIVTEDLAILRGEAMLVGDFAELNCPVGGLDVAVGEHLLDEAFAAVEEKLSADVDAGQVLEGGMPSAAMISATRCSTQGKMTSKVALRFLSVSRRVRTPSFEISSNGTIVKPKRRRRAVSCAA